MNLPLVTQLWISAIVLGTTADAWVPTSLSSPVRPIFLDVRNPLSTNRRRIQTLFFSSDATSEESSSTDNEPDVTAIEAASARSLVNGKEQQQEQELFQDSIEYAIPDGELWDKRNNTKAVDQVMAEMNDESQAVDVAAPEESATEIEANSVLSSVLLSDTISSLTQPRSYPLFLAEKAAEFVEASLSKSFAAPTTTFPFSFNSNNAGGYGIKENVVVLGSGWGSLSFLQYINAARTYNVTILSPRDHFCFTPLLAGASVGTVDLRSVCEPIASINRQAYYIPAMATHIDPSLKTVTYQNVQTGAVDVIEYDRLIVSVGAGRNTFGVPGVQDHCLFLRQVEDARTIKRAIANAFRLAAAAAEKYKQNDINNYKQQLQAMLTFTICGAGPTGIELAAELKDFLQQDAVRLYGAELVQHARIKIIQASKTVLAQFDPALQKEAVLQMNVQTQGSSNIFPERLVELILESSVTKVNKDTIELDGGEVKIPYGVAIWAAGNGPLPVTMQLIDALGPEQQALQDKARGRLAIDPWMRVIGSNGSILAVGDCSCITQDPLPATAQVASQQGEYLANLMNRKFDLSPPSASLEGEEDVLPPPKRDPARTEATLSDVIASVAMNNSVYAKPFQFLNLGILAYTGNGSALAQVTPTPDSEPIKGTGAIGNVVWRSLYWTKQVSWRNRFLVLRNWVNTDLFGRIVDKL